MKTSRGIVAVVFRRRGKKKEFLLLHRVLNWKGWEFPKGSIEKGEKPDTAVIRELSEETGIKRIVSIKKLRAIMRFFDSTRNCNREMQAFLVEVFPEEEISFANNNAAEHDAFEWVEAETLLGKISFENQKKIFRIALKAIGE